jgi:hypothetical protein
MTTLASNASPALVPRYARARWTWIYCARTDIVLALCWVPVFLGVHQLTTSAGATEASLLRSVVQWTLILSLLHQPLTLLLVYGDSKQFRLRPALFSITPVLAVVVVMVGVGLDLWLIVPIAAIWNTVHTVQQRYGLCRIYARKSGYGSARLDRALLFIGIGVAVLAAAASTTTATQLGRVSIGSTNADAVRTLTTIRPYVWWLLVPTLLAAGVVLCAVVRQEWDNRARANHAKWLYQGATLALIGGIVIDPLAGLVAWVLAHTVEYLIVVQRTMVSRYADGADSSVLGVLGRGRRRWSLLTAFLVVCFFVDASLDGWVPSEIYLTIIYTLGVLHFTYDAFIWKMRKPAVARNFGIMPAA